MALMSQEITRQSTSTHQSTVGGLLATSDDNNGNKEQTPYDLFIIKRGPSNDEDKASAM